MILYVFIGIVVLGLGAVFFLLKSEDKEEVKNVLPPFSEEKAATGISNLSHNDQFKSAKDSPPSGAFLNLSE